MEEICEKRCVFEESLEIDFDFEFDVDKFFDFLKTETVEEVRESESWFYSALGHPPSPLLLKLGLISDETGASDQNVSPRCKQDDAHSDTSDSGESETSSRDSWKNKAKPANYQQQSGLSKNSRLLQPTASLIAKQNRQFGVNHETRVPKPRPSLKSPGAIDDTKRQKLEYGYLRKVGHLKHLTNFSHKLGSSNVKSCNAKSKPTVAKEPCLETATRAQRRRSQNVAEIDRDSNKVSEPKKNTTSLTNSALKALKKSVQCSIKENKDANKPVGKPMRCGRLNQDRISGGRVTVIAC